MGEALEKAKTFEERMKERIKDSIGDMITDEELSKIVAKGIQAAFFDPYYVDDGYRGKKVVDEPLITGIVKECVNEQVGKEVNKWFVDNSDKVKEIIDEVIKAGLTKTVFSYMDNKMNNSLMELQQNFQNVIDNIIQNKQY